MAAFERDTSPWTIRADLSEAYRAYWESLSRAGSRYAYTYRTGPCSRDSGNPMLLQTIKGDWLVVGIANATDGNLCATNGGLAVYTSVAPLIEFIRGYTARD